MPVVREWMQSKGQARMYSYCKATHKIIESWLWRNFLRRCGISLFFLEISIITFQIDRSQNTYTVRYVCHQPAAGLAIVLLSKIEDYCSMVVRHCSLLIYTMFTIFFLSDNRPSRQRGLAASTYRGS